MIYFWSGLMFFVWLLATVINYCLLKALILQEGVDWTNSTRIVTIMLSAYSVPLTIVLMVGAVHPIDTFEEWLTKPARW